MLFTPNGNLAFTFVYLSTFNSYTNKRTRRRDIRASTVSIETPYNKHVVKARFYPETNRGLTISFILVSRKPACGLLVARLAVLICIYD